MKRLKTLALVALLPVFASAAGTATVRVTNAGSVPIVVAGRTVRPASSEAVSVPAGESGTIAVSAPDGWGFAAPAAYPSLRIGATYSLRLAPIRGAVPVPSSEDAAGSGTVPAASIASEGSGGSAGPVVESEPKEVPDDPFSGLISELGLLVPEGARALGAGDVSSADDWLRIGNRLLAWFHPDIRDLPVVRDAVAGMLRNCSASFASAGDPGNATMTFRYLLPGEVSVDNLWTVTRRAMAEDYGSSPVDLSGFTIGVLRCTAIDGEGRRLRPLEFLLLADTTSEPGRFWHVTEIPREFPEIDDRAPCEEQDRSPHPEPVPESDAASTSGGGSFPEETLVELRLALSAGFEDAIGRYSSVSASEATNRAERATCGMPGDCRGFFRDFVRFSQGWSEPLTGDVHVVCLYNPWSDGALLFPMRNLGTTPEMLATPVVLAGETLRGERPILESPPSLVPPDGDVAGEVFERTKRTRNGFRELARGGDWKEPASFESKDGSFRQGQLKAVFSRILLLLEEQSSVVVLEASEKSAAVRYGDFLQAMMDGADVSSFFVHSDESEWNRLPEPFRRSLWPVRIVPYEDELLVILQSPAFPETALFVEFPDDPGNRSASLSFLDFGSEQ